MDFERHLEACLGFLELDLSDSAWEELDQIEPADQNRPEVLHARIAVLMKENAWEKAIGYCDKLCKVFPDSPVPFIHRAFCLHELRRTEEAKSTLLKGPASLRSEPLFHYNLACYEAQLGNLISAHEWLKASIAMDNSFRELAREDVDLAPLWISFSKNAV